MPVEKLNPVEKLMPVEKLVPVGRCGMSAGVHLAPPAKMRGCLGS